MAKRNRHGEPWEAKRWIGIVDTKERIMIEFHSEFYDDRNHHYRMLVHAARCVTACAGLTKKELERGVVPRK